MSTQAGEPIDSKFEIGHVLFIDIVGYSKLLIEEQKERLGQLTKRDGSGARIDRALATIEKLKKKSVHGYVPPFNLALVYLGLGDLDRAMDLLEQANADDSQWMMYLKVDRVFDPLRSNPRFVALMKECHFEN